MSMIFIGVGTAHLQGVDICHYCQDCNCRDCIVNEWKVDAGGQ